MYECCNFPPIEIETSTIISLSTLWKNINNINSHSNLRPFKNVKVRHFIWGFNKVSFEISTKYVRMYNFLPIELGTYTIISLSKLWKKLKIKTHSNLQPFNNMEVRRFILGFQQGFVWNVKRECTNFVIFGRKNLNDTIISLSTLWKKIKINGHSNLRPLKYMKMRYIICCLNGVSF
jgi:hypothetical protein